MPELLLPFLKENVKDGKYIASKANKISKYVGFLDVHCICSIQPDEADISPESNKAESVALKILLL